MSKIKIVECPRDAMQGIEEFIPSHDKVNYLNQLLKVDFDTLDFGSFVSPKAIPQLKDTAIVLKDLDLSTTRTKLLAIVANLRGAQDACSFDEIAFLGYPFSVSETFQRRNTNASIDESLKRIESIQELAIKHKKQLLVYLSMGFGNPYGDPFNEEVVGNWIERLAEMGIQQMALSDTIGVSEPGIISRLFSQLIPAFPDVEIGAHLHTTPETWKEKVVAAHENGCRKFDGALLGFGGCPMATDQLTGNMATENLVSYFDEKKINLGLKHEEFLNAQVMASSIFK